MKNGKYLECLFKEFLTACGCLMIINMVLLSISSIKTIDYSLFWQIILGALAYTLFKFALANKYELEEKTQIISFYICFLLYDIPIILWLWFFSPSKIVNIDLIIIYIVIALIVKGVVCVMMHINGHTQARQLNEKLKEYKNYEKEQL